MMKKICLSIASLLVAACTTHQSLTVAHPIDHSISASKTKPSQITGKVDQLFKSGILGKSVTNTVSIYFDDVLYITGNLDRQGFGQLPGLSYQDKIVSSTCNSKPTGIKTAELSCTVFINSEYATTLVMPTKTVY